ncbi:MAG TPA: sigma-E factor regulatory protein RseB domain-containing protein, partial [Arenicellales bacterium]|nr:sigma-E factor regulatory protein RseB domain-containing protein [Arenicellales bacterium]
MLTTALFSQPLVAGEAFDWLERMSAAISDLNYRGTFVYQHNGKLEAMSVVHRGGEDSRQRLFALSGAAREVIRDQEGVICIFPDSKAVMVDRNLPRGPFATLPRDLEQLNHYYHFSLGGSERVLERHGRMVVIEPRDNYRYGYRFWLDREHALPLRSALVTA